MKNILFFVAILFLAVACDSESSVPENVTSDQLVTVSAKISSQASGEVGNGAAINRCILEVYNAADNSLVGERQIAKPSSGTAQFKVKLESSQAYKLVLWADYSADGSNDKFYNTTEGLQSISRITGEYTGNNDQLDAFYACKEFSAGETTVNVEMQHPFAQLNVYASDFYDLVEADRPTKVSVSFGSVYTSFNALTGVASGEAKLQYAAPVAIIGKNGQLSYDYLFASADKQTLPDFTMSFSNESGTAFAPYKFSSIPLQRNYATHVTGNLLTNSGELDVVVKPGFGEPDIPFDIYDGSSLVEPDMDGNNVNVNSAANMAYVLNNLSQFNNKVINMNCNIDFAGAEIKNSTSRISLSMQGNGHTIKNLTLMSNDIACGLIPNMAGGTVSDLTIDNFRVVRDESKSDSYSGVIVGESHGNVVIKNCRVTNSEVNGINKVGTIVGFASDGIMEVKDCIVENTSVISHTWDGGDCGGIVGFIGNSMTSATISGNKFLNSTVEVKEEENMLYKALLEEILKGYIDIQQYDEAYREMIKNFSKQVFGYEIDLSSGRGACLYVATCFFSGNTVSISAEKDALTGSKRIIRGAEDGGLVRYQGLLGIVREGNLNGGKLYINGVETEVDTNSEKVSIE